VLRAETKALTYSWLIRPATTSAVSATGVSATLGSVPHAMRAIAGGALTCTTIDVMLNVSLIKAPPLELWPKIVRRIELPRDVETRLVQPMEIHHG